MCPTVWRMVPTESHDYLNWILNVEDGSAVLCPCVKERRDDDDVEDGGSVLL